MHRLSGLKIEQTTTIIWSGSLLDFAAQCSLHRSALILGTVQLHNVTKVCIMLNIALELPH